MSMYDYVRKNLSKQREVVLELDFLQFSISNAQEYVGTSRERRKERRNRKEKFPYCPPTLLPPPRKVIPNIQMYFFTIS